METLLIIALLASNVWLIRKVLTKPDVQSVGKNKMAPRRNHRPQMKLRLKK